MDIPTPLDLERVSLFKEWAFGDQSRNEMAFASDQCVLLGGQGDFVEDGPMANELSKSLKPEKALIFRITHRANAPWLLRHGLHCRNADVQDPNFVTIGHADLIASRQDRVIACSSSHSPG